MVVGSGSNMQQSVSNSGYLFQTNFIRPFKLKKNSGDHSEGGTPDPISNSVVKTFSADGTARATVWESRSSPGIIYIKAS